MTSIFDFNTVVSFTSFTVSKSSKSEEIKYFDFDYKQKKKDHITIKSRAYNSVVNVDKHIYYIEIYVFVNKLKNLQHQHHDIDVVVNFRDNVLAWYFMKIFDLKRTSFRVNNMNIWYNEFIKKFKMKFVTIMSHFTDFTNRFDMNSLKIMKFKIWIMHMRYLIKTVVFDLIYNQFIIMWNQLNVQLRRDIFMSEFHTSLISFLEQLNDKIFIWKKMIERQLKHQLLNRRFSSQFQNQQSDQSIKRENKSHVYMIEKNNENLAVYDDENEYFVN